MNWLKSKKAQAQIVGYVLAVIVGIVCVSVMWGITQNATATTARNDTIVFTAYDDTGKQALAHTYHDSMVVRNNTTTFTNVTNYTFYPANNTLVALNATGAYPRIVLNENTYANYNTVEAGYIEDATIRTIVGVSPMMFAVVILMIVAYALMTKR